MVEAAVESRGIGPGAGSFVESRGEAADTTPAAEPGPSAWFLSGVAHDFARRHLVLSAGFEVATGDQSVGTELLRIGASTPIPVVHNIGVRLGRAVRAVVEDTEPLARAIDRAYAEARERGDGPIGSLETGTAPAASSATVRATDVEALLAASDRDLLATSGKGPVVRFVDAVLFEALGKRASDVHIQPLSDRTLVRYRVDGVLHTAHTLPPAAAVPVVSRIKVMGAMDIAERRVPQDGRASVTIGRRAAQLSVGSGEAGETRAIDLRVSTLPTSYGERVVIRLLDTRHTKSLSDFAALGMPQQVQNRFLSCASRSSGIILVTGPTGSGKTTTLYTTLHRVAAGLDGGAGGLNVMTIEDPIEYELSTAGVAISQAQVNTKKGVTFAKGLRHILRQDPDVVMVGEIRDEETARIAIQASLTGHLVLSTLHTNDAASAVTRLVDLGVEPFLVGASLACVLAQRLVRRMHEACGGMGCQTCFGTGFQGRIGVFELLAVDERVRALVSAGATASAIREAGRGRGMRTLHEAGMELAERGVTTRLEIERVAHLLDDAFTSETCADAPQGFDALVEATP